MDNQIKNNTADRPKIVTNAIKILYLSLAASALRGFIQMPQLLEKMNLPSVVIGMIFVLGVTWFFIYLINSGKNWARIVFSVLFILMIPNSIKPLLNSFLSNPFLGIVGGCQTILQLIAVILLFQTESSIWFKFNQS